MENVDLSRGEKKSLVVCSLGPSTMNFSHVYETSERVKCYNQPTDLVLVQWGPRDLETTQCRAHGRASFVTINSSMFPELVITFE